MKRTAKLIPNDIGELEGYVRIERVIHNEILESHP